MTTTVKLSEETKAALEAENRENETYDETVARILGASDFETRVREIVQEELAIQERKAARQTRR